MDACECYGIETGFRWCVYFSRQLTWSDLNCTFFLTCGGWQFQSQSGSFVLSWGPWILPREAVVQGSAGDWAEHQAEPGLSSLAVSHCLWLPWSLCPPVPVDRKPWVWFLIGTSAGQPWSQSSKNGEFMPCQSFLPVFNSLNSAASHYALQIVVSFYILFRAFGCLPMTGMY